jgi:hypothetical protein
MNGKRKKAFLCNQIYVGGEINIIHKTVLNATGTIMENVNRL